MTYEVGILPQGTDSDAISSVTRYILCVDIGGVLDHGSGRNVASLVSQHTPLIARQSSPNVIYDRQLHTMAKMWRVHPSSGL